MKQFESFRLDTSNQCLWLNGAALSLPPKPFAVLQYLVEHPGRLISHDELLDALWPETYVQPQVLRTYMLDLRKLLGDDAGQPRFIRTIPKRGYSFVAAVVECDGPGENPGSGHDNGPRNRHTPRNVNPEESIDRIVGRDAELGMLHRHFATLADGLRKVVFVTGEPGIGKTALVDSFSVFGGQAAGLSPNGLSPNGLPANGLPATGLPRVKVARGQCVKGLATREEYYPVKEALAQLCASAHGERACRILARLAPAWLSALGRDAESAQTDAERVHSRERMPGDLCAAIEELAADEPLLLIFEDLQWADGSTLDLVSALARRRSRSMLMIVATYRSRDLTADHPLKALQQDLAMRRLCVEIPVAPLTRKAVAELLSRNLDQEALPQGLAAFVHQHSEGNPLFLIAIVEHLIGQRSLVRVERDGTACWEQQARFTEMEAGVPDGLAKMIEQEIECLTAEEQRLLEAGSFMRVAFPAWAVAAALERDVAEIEEACDGLARRVHFLERAGQDELPDGTCSGFYVFAHGLYREVLYQRQTATRRARRHLRIAIRLGELFAGREADVAREMAMHFEAAAEWHQALGALHAAVSHAGERHAYPEALELLEHARRVANNLKHVEREAEERALGLEIERVHEAMAGALNEQTIEADDAVSFLGAFL